MLPAHFYRGVRKSGYSGQFWKLESAGSNPAAPTNLSSSCSYRRALVILDYLSKSFVLAVHPVL